MTAILVIGILFLSAIASNFILIGLFVGPLTSQDNSITLVSLVVSEGPNMSCGLGLHDGTIKVTLKFIRLCRRYILSIVVDAIASYSFNLFVGGFFSCFEIAATGHSSLGLILLVLEGFLALGDGKIRILLILLVLQAEVLLHVAVELFLRVNLLV